jgi:hypothetical protein
VKKIVTLAELHKETGCTLDRATFRRAMNNRRKSSPELERVSEGLYRFNPRPFSRTA